MKYFTPELLARNQSEDDDVLNEVEAEWESRGDKYIAYINSVKEEFPSGLKHIEDSYYLHDATIQGMGKRAGQFFMVLQLDTPPESLLSFTYDLVEDYHIDLEAVPLSARIGGTPMWQYNEIEKVEGSPPTWRESLLLSNGWEITLHFRDIIVEEAQAILPAPRLATASLPSTVVSQPA